MQPSCSAVASPSSCRSLSGSSPRSRAMHSSRCWVISAAKAASRCSASSVSPMYPQTASGPYCLSAWASISHPCFSFPLPISESAWFRSWAACPSCRHRSLFRHRSSSSSLAKAISRSLPISCATRLWSGVFSRSAKFRLDVSQPLIAASLPALSFIAHLRRDDRPAATRCADSRPVDLRALQSPPVPAEYRGTPAATSRIARLQIP